MPRPPRTPTMRQQLLLTWGLIDSLGHEIGMRSSIVAALRARKRVRLNRADVIRTLAPKRQRVLVDGQVERPGTGDVTLLRTTEIDDDGAFAASLPATEYFWLNPDDSMEEAP